MLRPLLHCFLAWFLSDVSSIQPIVVGWIFGNRHPWITNSFLWVISIMKSLKSDWQEMASDYYSSLLRLKTRMSQVLTNRVIKTGSCSMGSSDKNPDSKWLLSAPSQQDNWNRPLLYNRLWVLPTGLYPKITHPAQQPCFNDYLGSPSLSY